MIRAETVGTIGISGIVYKINFDIFQLQTTKVKDWQIGKGIELKLAASKMGSDIRLTTAYKKIHDRSRNV